MPVNELAKVIRKAIQQDERSLYRIAIDAGLPYSTVHRFSVGEREDLILGTAWKICKALGLELRPKRKGR